jgi:2-keto-4-pentenoate hydratase/2-oxohepta-3-ene-1,7-dioic acid hydratase in catechol pathway
MFPYKINLNGKQTEVQSIYCIGRNYVEHIEELKNETPDKPLVFVKPKGAILLGKELKIPTTTESLHHECEIVLSVGKSGENINKSEALSYISGMTLGLDMTARDLQDVEKKKGHPWTQSKCQKGFAVLGEWVRFESKNNFTLEVNANVRQSGDTSKMIYDFSAIISYLSELVPLYEGDIIYTGTPAGVAAVSSGDKLVGKLNGKESFTLLIR